MTFNDYGNGYSYERLGYQSPVEIIASQIETKMENDTMTAIQHYGINVDKEELLKALNYDRNQYAKGYADAKKDYERPWINIENEDKLVDHYWYLIAHKDYATPMKAIYHSDFPHFVFATSNGHCRVSYIYEGKVTHYMELPELPLEEVKDETDN